MLDTPLTDRMYIDQGEVIRVRVEADEFYDFEPGPPKAQDGVAVKLEPKRAPYVIVVRSFLISVIVYLTLVNINI
jgi:DNA-directed RNA polymerase III subunit RPC8